jgi:hypothetical protein
MGAIAKSLCPCFPAGFMRNSQYVYGSQRKSQATGDPKTRNLPEEGVNEK